MKRSLKKFFPPGSFGFKILKKTAILLGLTSAIPTHEMQYNDWYNRTESFTWSPSETLTYQPLISIIVPVFNPPAMHFLAMVYSTVNQTYQNWELILVNASTQMQKREMTQESKLIDSRIRVINLGSNKGIAGNTNVGIAKARGTYIGFLDHDDTLSPGALYEVARLLQGNHKPRFIYTDEDKLTNNGEFHVDPHFKPDWSPQLLRELNYINHFAVIERKLLNEVGPHRLELDGAQDYDLFLRAIDHTNEIAHVPRVLYHWRTSSTSTSENFSQKKNVLDAGVKALEDHLERNHQHGTVVPVKNQPGFYKIKYALNNETKIAIIILPSVFQQEYRKFIFNFIDSLKDIKQEINIVLQNLVTPLNNIPANINLHFVNKKNRRAFIHKAVDIVDADICLVVGCAVLPLDKDWLTSLAGLLSQVQSIAIATPLIMAGDRKTIIDAGYVSLDKKYLPLFQGYLDDQHTTFGNSNWARNIDAVGPQCFMIRTNLLRAGVDQLQEENSKVFFSQSFFEKIIKEGKQIVSWPFSHLVYVGNLVPPNKESRYFNSNLVVSKTEFCPAETIYVTRNYKDE